MTGLYHVTRRLRTRLRRVLLGVGVGMLLATMPAAGQGSCDEVVTIPEAEKRYATGNFDEVFRLLKPCADKGFSDNARVQAYKILSLTYLAIDSVAQSSRAIGQLLTLNPRFEPDFSAPPRYKALFQWVRETQEQVVQVTSVSKKAEDIRYAPATVVVLTQKDIEQRGYQTLEEVLHDLPGFDVMRGNGLGYSYFYQRGYRSTSNDRTLLLIDGVEENDIVSSHILVCPQYALSDIERVEVIYGPASTMYGANAFVGVINIITRSLRAQPGPSRMMRVTGQTRVGPNNTRYVDGVLGGRTSDVAFSVTGRVYSSDETNLGKTYPEWDFSAREAADYTSQLDLTGKDATGSYRAQQYVTRTNLLSRFPNSDLYTATKDSAGQVTALRLTRQGAEQAATLDNHLFGSTLNGRQVTFDNHKLYWLVRGKLEFKDLTLSLLDWKTNEGATPWFNNRTTISTANSPRWITHNRAVSLTYSKAFNDQFQLLNITSFLLHEIDGNTSLVAYNGYFNGKLGLLELARDSVPAATVTYQYRISTQLRNETRFFWTPFYNLDVSSGIEVRSGLIQGNYITSTQDVADETGSLSAASVLAGGNNFRTTDLGAYSQVTYRLYKVLKLVGGLRVDHNQIRRHGGYGTVANPRLSAIYSLGKAIFKVTYAQAFKDASFLQKYGTTATRKLPNPTLRPEQVRNLEFSAYLQATRQLSGSVVSYFSSYSNAVGVAQVTLEDGSTTQQFQALGQRYIWGLQAEAAYRAERLNVWANATYTNPLDRSTNLRISDIADYMVNAGVNYQFFRRLSGYLSGNYVSERRTGAGTSGSLNPATRFAPFAIFNANLTCHDLLPGLKLQLAVSNLLDKEYFTPGVREADNTIYTSRYPQDRRFISLGLYYTLQLPSAQQ